MLIVVFHSHFVDMVPFIKEANALSVNFYLDVKNHLNCCFLMLILKVMEINILPINFTFKDNPLVALLYHYILWRKSMDSIEQRYSSTQLY
jgi:hypothetical protein